MRLSTSDAVVSNLPGQRRMLDVVRASLRSSRQVSIAVSFFRYSGFGLVADDLKEFQERGGRLRLLVSTYMFVTQPDALKAVLAFPGVTARLHLASPAGAANQGFHAKMYVLDDEPAECWVGSSNFTKGGLATNIEANLRHLGDPEVTVVRSLFEQLWSRADVLPLTHDLIEDYRRSIPPIEQLPPLPALRLADERAVYNINDPTDHRPLIPRVRPNEAQIEALRQLASLRESGERRAAIVAAPGVGKTFLAVFDAQAMDAESLLFLSNRLEHVTQAERTYRHVFADSRSYGRAFAGQCDSEADFLFATVQSALSQPAVTGRHFDYVVIDEFHHASAPSYRALLEKLDHSFLLGLTATPERQDGHDVLELCDYNVAYEVRLVEAINRGWLMPFHYFGIADESVNYGEIPWRSGRFDPEKLETALMIEERVDTMLRHCEVRGFDGPKRVTVGFCAGVRHARFMAEALVRRGLVAEAVVGEIAVDVRESIYARLQDPTDSLEWIFVADLLNEGVDLPAINSIVFLRPTESATIFIQQLGRGLRLTPHAEVLTALDFVGHHNSAWLAIEALNDPAAPRGPSTVEPLDLTPPSGCEVVLDVRTLEVLAKVERVARTKKEACLDAYRRLKKDFDIAHPRPVDLLSDPLMPGLAEIRGAFGSWIGLRIAAGDAEPWEREIEAGGASHQLLIAAEKDWQAQRVYPYAALWGLCAQPKRPEDGYEAFFDRFPRWRVEYKPYGDSGIVETLKKKLGHLLDAESLAHDALISIPANLLLTEIEARLQYTLEKDFRIRHGGVLHRPSDLILHRRYTRPEIVNYFAAQYDPARHNAGVLKFDCDGAQIVIIAKLDTSGAVTQHQYRNELQGEGTFLWTSQNQQSPDTGTGRDIVEHRQGARTIHIFVQPGSHSKAFYLGTANVDIGRVRGSQPMSVPFLLEHPVTAVVLEQLEGN